MQATVPAGLDRKEAEVYLRLDPKRLPKHIAIIMDGNGRWARRRHLPRIAGHRAGVSSVRSTVETAARIGIPALTLYAFSEENWKKRPPSEVDFLMGLLCRYLKAEVPTLNKNNIRLEYIGRQHELPPSVQEKMQWAREATAHNTGMVLTLALNYSARTEMVDAFRSIVDAAARNGGLDHLEIDEDAVSRHLYTRHLPDPDLVVRTSGEMRLSNFLLWQLAYAEIYVTPTLWPEFRGVHLLEGIAEYQKRERRYGGLAGDAVAISTRSRGTFADKSVRATHSSLEDGQELRLLHLLKRILTAVVLIPIVLLLVLRAPVPVLALVAALVALLTVQELLKLAEAYGIRPLRWPTYIFVGLFFLLLAINPGNEKPLLSTAIFVYSAGFAAAIAPFVFLTVAMRRVNLSTAFPAAMVSAFAFAYVALPLGFLVQLREQWSGAFLLLVFAAAGMGRRHLCLLRWTFPGPSSDVAAHQSQENLGGSAGISARESGGGDVALQLCPAHQHGTVECASYRTT